MNRSPGRTKMQNVREIFLISYLYSGNNGLLEGGKVQPNHEKVISAFVSDFTAQSCECDSQQTIL